MLWTIIIAEALLILLILGRMIIKRASNKREEVEDAIPEEKKDEPALDLPEEERWD